MSARLTERRVAWNCDSFLQRGFSPCSAILVSDGSVDALHQDPGGVDAETETAAGSCFLKYALLLFPGALAPDLLACLTNPERVHLFHACGKQYGADDTWSGSSAPWL